MRVLSFVCLACLFLLALWPLACVVARAGGSAILQWGKQNPRSVLRLALPTIDRQGTRPAVACGRLLARLAGVRLGTWEQVLASQLPATFPSAGQARPAAEREAPPPLAARLAGDGNGGALVGIYHTHTGETYALSDGTARFDGRAGQIVTVGRALARALATRGIKVVYSEKIHDVPYARSYLASRATAEAMLRSNPGLVALLDVHRDAAKTRAQSIVRIGGEDVATVLLVVGSDAREPFPTWRQNHAFAEHVAKALNERYPGLCQGVRVKSGRYNQFLHPHALLVEIGSVENYTEEAVRAAELFAEVLADVVGEMNGKTGGEEVPSSREEV
ncbi:MAG: stage II sporulation protein P [Desulfotomaculales bacterium]